ncbi:DUF4333 domain-containing protein [Streptomyces tubbatahanensis]|uniref:DUF4333 domain-containing protein n=1 Tax=Streptomyces tubbatahanensis TaxID=2923272 RepID=A0ABY3XPG6_9ACTN|nr:DUF4333 domain-containing protein [Streptomyces tubbatahanensis]UNS96347.1 DUF4333 domain-containing protein [Streptomyces tubbatahanensis]
MRGLVRTTVPVVVSVLALSACSVEAGAPNDAVTTEELEKQVDRGLTEKVGQSPKDVDCPDELEAKKGAHTRCTLSTDDGLRFGVTVTIDRLLSEDEAHFDIKVDQEPK